MGEPGTVNVSLSIPAGIWNAIGNVAAEAGGFPGELIVKALEDRYGAKPETPPARTNAGDEPPAETVPPVEPPTEADDAAPKRGRR